LLGFDVLLGAQLFENEMGQRGLRKKKMLVLGVGEVGRDG